MNRVKEALTKKYAGIPGYAWAGVVVLAAYLFWPKGAGDASTGTPTGGKRGGVSGSWPGGAGAPTGGKPPRKRPPVIHPTIPPEPGKHPLPPPDWPQPPEPVVPIPHGTVIPGPVGGPRSIGSRDAVETFHGHTGIKRRVILPHYVKAAGGAGNYASEVERVADQTGIHPARLRALNSRPGPYVRVA